MMAKAFYQIPREQLQSWTVHRINNNHQLVPKVSYMLHIQRPLIYNWHNLDTVQDQLLKTSWSRHFAFQKKQQQYLI